jgi:hypothetical protein
MPAIDTSGIIDALSAVDASELAGKTDLKHLEPRLYEYFGGIIVALSLSRDPQASRTTRHEYGLRKNLLSQRIRRASTFCPDA